jgi:STE24 endopeptidase
MIISSIPEEILGIPFSLYKQFKLEKKFGFNTMTIKLWISDFIKDGIISIIMSALLAFVASIFFVKCTNSWWFILATVLILFTFLMQVIYPKFIAPLFNKFTPLEEGSLKQKITTLLGNTGFVSDGLFIMDASKRSKHSNAYFTGFGKSKRIVLYDTLVEKLSEDELVAVLGHELGHFKLKHILKRLIFVIPLEFLVLFGLYFLAQFVNLYTGFGFSTITAANVSQVQFIGLFLAIMIYSSVSELISPFASFSSRKHEYQADEYAAKITGNPLDLINALIKLNSENLSELIPPKIYVFWNYSHPTIVERTVALKKLIKTEDVAK